MRKKIALFIALVLSISVLGGCGKEDPPAADGAEGTNTDYRFEQCGLAYSLPKEWFERDNVNLLPVSFVDPSADIYARIEYNYAPDENMDELNDIESEIPVEELMLPLFTLLVVKDEKAASQTVTDEIALYKSCEELPQQDGFRFYYLTDYSGSTLRFSQNSKKTFETLKSELPLMRKTIETFPPDESTVQAQVNADKEFLNFMSTTLNGDPITSTIFYDYDITVVNFWASYCYPDINELATLQAFYKQLKEKYTNINFVQVVIDTPGEEAEKTVATAYKEAGVTFTSIVPDRNMSSWIIDNLNGLPTTIFVDKTGKPLSTKIEGVKELDYYMETTQSMLESTKNQ
ncbi:thiol-disulfide oxidoreductase ResA [Anaerotignum neopropionicum]|uniref:Thiol-disulfide oxidoreductase ResA n=1 Tax=Anaerotignum neopropionicum TaxID=36847 RepID=A0A136WDU3_9FIRM|nr:TlpA disulfide reductase family protein [Anaerotignum neopropionicum]KXL52654.1 thiol-disulfide oxidoreductase ResA [Anaerotignum neopropionicum]